MDPKDKTILITGAAGFIGSHVAERLAGEGTGVKALVRRPPAHPIPGVSYCLGDLRDHSAVGRAVSGCEAIIHAAALQPSSPLPTRTEFRAVNVEGTEALLHAFRPHGDGRFLLVSTINVHGLPPPPQADAGSPLLYSGDRYTDSKVDAERAAWSMARAQNIPLTVIRPACTFGPRSAAWTLRPIEQLRQGRPVLIGGGRGLCNPAYIDNLVDLIVAALKSEAAAGQAFIGSDGVGIPWFEFYSCYARLLGVRPRSIPYLPARLGATLFDATERLAHHPGPLSRSNLGFYAHSTVFDIAKNKLVLGWSPRVTFQEAMRRTAQWLRDRNLV